ncbi:PHP domain-containing protein [Neiella sp. HB171785]|uniref:PHP domain-containing protein n=1 Tax=Neiella litorisoli TaxID=2771431 RepID=A0A8J6QL33_9GAMM|nr:PHP domain-containing protein [Neiella litorisoli]MBD1391314.1 PHP domain-containing protein [Neiella litorisoli]
MKIDLHCHSTCSDGTLTPQELLLRASNMQVDVLALTDHDSVEGVAKLREAAQAVKPPIQIINGVEISCAWHGLEIHIVGLHFDLQHPAITELLGQQAERRLTRAMTIAARLQRKGLDNCWSKVSALAQGGQVTRSHFARLLVKEGWVSLEKTAFKKYLRKGRNAYVAPPWCSIPEAIAAIQAGGGRAVLAHPLDYQLAGNWLSKLLDEFSDAGGDAIEVAQCQQTPAQRLKLAELARQYNLLASQGSDFHFPAGRRELGRSLELPADLTPVWDGWLTANEA